MFINYRGEDSHSYGALLYTELARQFGTDRVFLDCESIPAGADFVEVLLGRVRSARVLLAVIGPRWLTAADTTGRRRIDDPTDWIRRELAEAFATSVRVIPVLTEQVELPIAADLPADIAALSRCQYRRLRRREPTTDLARIVSDLTSLDPTLAATAPNPNSTPRQLPPAPRQFTGRAAELITLTNAATTVPNAGATVVISAIGGAGGIGKTTLALHWAYQHLDRFPDGQLYVNLRGFDPSGQPSPVGPAVRGFLDALGANPATLPVDVEAQAARYRSLVAGRRMLIVLDNARDVDQVTPLLPGSPSCTVLVTSRHRLAGLATASGAHLLDLDVLPAADARALLARHLGAQRPAAEPQAVADLLTVCAGLPLAVRIVAARAEQHPTFPLAVLADELRDVSARLDGLDAGDLHANLRAVLSWSQRALSTPAATLFGLLGIAPGPDISLPAAACLADLPPRRTRVVLRELENASLVQQHAPGRYRMHDLIRLYSTDTAHQQLPLEVRDAALRRVVDFYLHTAYAGHLLVCPHPDRIGLDEPVAGCHPYSVATEAAAWTWLDAEHPNVLATQQFAAERGWQDAVWQLAWSLSIFHVRRGRLHDDVTAWRAGLAAADHLGHPTPQTWAYWSLGAAYARVGKHTTALDHLRQALALAEQAGDHRNQAHTHHAFAWAWGQLGNDEQALEHARHALRLYQAVHDPAAEVEALNQVGWHAARLGQHDQAQRHLEAALARCRRRHHPVGEAQALSGLGYLACHTGYPTQALNYYRQALARYREAAYTYAEADTLDRLGDNHVTLGQRDQARAVWREALQLYRLQGRVTDATRVQRQFDDLDRWEGTAGCHE